MKHNPEPVADPHSDTSVSIALNRAESRLVQVFRLIRLVSVVGYLMVRFKLHNWLQRITAPKKGH